MALWIKHRSDKSISDEELLKKYTETGDLDHLGTLYSRYMDLVYGVCLKYLNDRDRSQDAVMEIFERLVTELFKRDVTNFRSWLYVVTRNHCLMALRAGKGASSRVRSIEDMHLEFVENDSEMHPIDEDCEANYKLLEDCIKRLKEEQKECIELFYYKSMCYREIADTLKMDEKKVKSYLQNGKRNLKICLEAGDGEKQEK